MSESRVSESETVRESLGLRLSRLIKAKERARFHGAKTGHPLGISHRRMNRIEASRRRRKLKEEKDGGEDDD